MSRERQEAFWRIAETCPKVRERIHHVVRQALDDGLLIDTADPMAMSTQIADAAFDAAIETGTMPLRDALIECERERLRAESERDDLQEEVDRLKSRVDDLEVEVKDANRRADVAEAQVS